MEEVPLLRDHNAFLPEGEPGIILSHSARCQRQGGFCLAATPAA